MAPEVCNCIENRKAYSPLMADVYSLGVTLYAILIGELPLKQENFDMLTTSSEENLDNDQINSFSFKKNYAISTEWRELLTKMMHPDPSCRLTMKQVLEHPIWFPL